jgi:hydrogenase maturation protease
VNVLVLGYGNRNRNDDGVGWVVAEAVERLALPGVECLTAHQLEVDFAETITGYEAVIFVDASIPDSRQAVHREVVKPRFDGHAVAHYFTPGDVLALCKTLYDREPHAILFSIRGHDFHFGTTLSPATAAAADDVVRQILKLIPKLQRHVIHA